MIREYICYEELRIGQEVTQKFLFDRADIFKFAEIIEDKKSFHFSREAAEEVGFSDIIGHGAHLLALIAKVIGEKLPGFGTIYLSQKVEFLKPVMPNDTIIVRIVVVEKRPGKRVVLKTEISDLSGVCYVKGTGVVKTFR